MAQSIYDDSNQVSECSSWTISQKFALFGQIRFWLKCGLFIGWVIITREDEPPHPPSLLQHSVAAQFNSKSSCRAHSITLVLLFVWF